MPANSTCHNARNEQISAIYAGDPTNEAPSRISFKKKTKLQRDSERDVSAPHSPKGAIVSFFCARLAGRPSQAAVIRS